MHARALEAELTAAKERLRSEAMDDYASIKHLQRELATLTAERDELQAELERADAIYQRSCEVEHELRAELATMKEGAK